MTVATKTDPLRQFRYHVRSDKRSQASARELGQALRDLLAKAPDEGLARVTVAGICQEAGISRPAFYRQFDAVEDVAAWSADTRAAAWLRNAPAPGLAEFSPHWLCSTFVANLAKSTFLARVAKGGRPDIISHAFHIYMRSADEAHPSLLENCGIPPLQAELGIPMLGSAIALTLAEVPSEQLTLDLCVARLGAARRLATNAFAPLADPDLPEYSEAEAAEPKPATLKDTSNQ